VRVHQQVLGRGTGRNTRTAQKRAAEKALEWLETYPEALGMLCDCTRSPAPSDVGIDGEVILYNSML